MNKNKQKQFGKNIALQRKAKKLTQEQLAKELSVSREHLAKIETATRGISLSLLFKLCDKLGIEEKVLFEFEEK